jgi:RNA polymerase sigma-70 factor, ECF subfamily
MPMHPPIETVADHDDYRLMAAISDGDELAFQRLYRRYSSAVFSLALRITGQEHDAEDVVADVFWELWDKSARYNPSKSSPSTYLMMLARCRALDRKRGSARHTTHAILDWATDSRSLDRKGDLPDLPCVTAERRAIVEQALDKLNPNQRQAIESAFFDGLTYQAAAEKLGIPVGTMKGRVRSALEHLRNALIALRND